MERYAAGTTIPIEQLLGILKTPQGSSGMPAQAPNTAPVPMPNIPVSPSLKNPLQSMPGFGGMQPPAAMPDSNQFKQAILMIKAALDPEGVKSMLGKVASGVMAGRSAASPGMAPVMQEPALGQMQGPDSLEGLWDNLKAANSTMGVKPIFGDLPGVASAPGVNPELSAMLPNTPVGDSPEVQMDATAALMGLGTEGGEVKPPPGTNMAPAPATATGAPVQAKAGGPPPVQPALAPTQAVTGPLPFTSTPDGTVMGDTIYGNQAPVYAESIYGDLAPVQDQNGVLSKADQLKKALTGIKAPPAAGPSKVTTSQYHPGSSNFSYADQLLAQILQGNSGSLPKLPFV